MRLLPFHLNYGRSNDLTSLIIFILPTCLLWFPVSHLWRNQTASILVRFLLKTPIHAGVSMSPPSLACHDFCTTFHNLAILPIRYLIIVSHHLCHTTLSAGPASQDAMKPGHATDAVGRLPYRFDVFRSSIARRWCATVEDRAAREIVDDKATRVVK